MALETGVNSYIAYDGADSYMSARLRTEGWDQASRTDREKALMMATRRVDYMPVSGEKAKKGQRLQFPRKGQDGVPQGVLDAVCEEALFLLRGEDSRDELRAAGVRRYSMGALSEELAPFAPGLHSPEARALIAPYLGVTVIG